MSQPEPLQSTSDGVVLAGEAAGAGPPVVLLHGLTATRRYVLMGSRFLERRGYRVVTYDARGHGESSPAPHARGYEYADLVRDVDAVVDAPSVLVGNSMGAHTAAAFALEYPEQVAALVLVTPAYDGVLREREPWDALADGLERGGVEGFIAAWEPSVEERWRDTVLAVTRQRLGRHRDLGAVADALRVVPHSAPFEGIEALGRIEAPTLVVGSRDDADPGHPLAVAEAYAQRLPRGELIVEEPGKSPLAWRGSELSHAICDFLDRAQP